MSGRRTAPSQTFAFLAGNHDELHWLNRLDVNVPTKMNRILVIRGGAIGDFILTLPALKALRDAHPHAHIEIIGHKPVAALAEGRFYAQAVRSIEDARLSSFFVRN